MLIGVTGTGGTGTSTVAATIAHHGAELAMTAIVDLTRHGGLRHRFGVSRTAPGVAEVHAGAPPDACFTPIEHQLILIPGLRDPSDWTTVRDGGPLGAALEALRDQFATVVCDLGSDLEGSALTGSPDVADRHLGPRTAAALADLVLVVTAPHAEGLWCATATMRDLLQCGVEPNRIGVVVGRAPNRRSRRSLALRTRLMADSVSVWPTTECLVLPERRSVRRSASTRPRTLPPIDAQRLVAYVASLAGQNPPRRPSTPAGQLVAPGSLGISR